MVNTCFKYLERAPLRRLSCESSCFSYSRISSTPDMSDYHVFLSTLQATFLLFIHGHNYKNGAFKRQITQTTSPLNALHKLVASPLLNSTERTKFRELRDTLIILQRSNPENLSSMDILRRTLPFRNVSRIFQEDMRYRGHSSPSSPIQVHGPSTRTTVSAGTSNINDTITRISRSTAGVWPSVRADWSATNLDMVRASGAGRSLPMKTQRNLEMNGHASYIRQRRLTATGVEGGTPSEDQQGERMQECFA